MSDRTPPALSSGLAPRPRRVASRVAATALTAVLATALPVQAQDVDGGFGATAGLEVSIRSSTGDAVADAVVTLMPLDAPPPSTPAEPVVIDQRNVMFEPYVSLAMVGQQVVFTNSDDTTHHVYTFDQGNAFETLIAGQSTNPPIVFAEPGPVALGCNIHDLMLAYVYVMDASYGQVSGADGTVRFAALPPGAVEMTVWHPSLRAGDQGVIQTVVLEAAATLQQNVTLDLRRDRRRPGHGVY